MGIRGWIALGAVVVAGCASGPDAAAVEAPPTADEIRAIAKEAYVYGFPAVDSYRVQYAYFVDPKSPEFKAPWNRIHNMARVFTPEDRAIQTPNSDTPYSMLGMDLRTEPLVLTLPAMEKDRYFSVQFIDAYTYNFDYAGSRTTGNDGAKVLVAGPGWKGDTPTGITKVVRSETEFVLAAYRTQLFHPDDLANVRRIQSGYLVQPLSAYLGGPAPAPAPAVDFPVPLGAKEERTSLEFFNLLAFVLEHCPAHPSETDLRARFARIGVAPGRRIDVASLAPDVSAALSAGMADAWAELAALEKNEIATGKLTSGDLFGTREALGDHYLYRFAAAVIGIFGNSKQEAMYPFYQRDDQGRPLDGAAASYVLRFAPGELPPARAFWSVTIYGLPESLLVANPIHRYLINSPMLPNLKRDADGGITILVQHESPGPDRESNWLPAPKGPFMAAMRIYWPEEKALNGTWKAPPMRRAE